MIWEEMSYNKYNNRNNEDYTDNDIFYRIYEDITYSNTFGVEKVFSCIWEE